MIEENWLNGGGWTVYCADDSPAGVYVRNNMFGHDAKFGPASGNCAEWSGNTWSDTGGPI